MPSRLDCLEALNELFPPVAAVWNNWNMYYSRAGIDMTDHNLIAEMTPEAQRQNMERQLVNALQRNYADREEITNAMCLSWIAYPEMFDALKFKLWGRMPGWMTRCKKMIARLDARRVKQLKYTIKLFKIEEVK
jgi:hypothetical protein